MAKKIPSNFYQEVNVRKLNNVFDAGLPVIEPGDNGKVIKVVENQFALSEDLHTTVVANPEGSSTDELMTLKVGETIYAVNKPTFETIKSFKITIENGGQYKTNKPIIEFYDDGGNKANITSSDYDVECDKTYAGSANMNEVCSIETPDTPGTFTYTFVNDFNTLKYHFLKLTRGGTFVNDIAKNIKVELSSDGENYLTLFDETSMTWSDAVTYHMYDIATGEEASTLLPIVTSADNGQVLGVVGGVWDKMNVPNEVPAVSGSDNGKFLGVTNGAYSLVNAPASPNFVEYNIDDYGDLTGITVKGIYDLLSSGTMVILNNNGYKFYPNFFAHMDAESSPNAYYLEYSHCLINSDVVDMRFFSASNVVGSSTSLTPSRKQLS